MSKTIISPKGIGIYPRLNTPDTKYDANGVYKVDLKLDTEVAADRAFIEKLDELHRESWEAAIKDAVESGEFKTVEVAKKKVKQADLPYAYIEDEDGEDTQFVKVRFKMKAKVESKKTGEVYTLKPKIFDAHKQEMAKAPSIYSGSVLRVAFKPVLWFTKKLGAGVKLQLEAVQIIELVSGSGGGDAESYGFGDEDGYSYEAPAEQPFDSDEDEGDEGKPADGSSDF